MHILFITDNFPPEVNAPASRTFEHCRKWAAEGHQVTVVTCAPNFPMGRVYDGYRNRVLYREEMSGIATIRVITFITSNSGFFSRILDYLSFMASAIVAGLFVKKVDIIVATSPQFFTTIAAFILSKIKRKPWVFELRDLWPDSISAVGALRSPRVLGMLEKLELFLYKKANLIVTVTYSFRQNLIARGIASAKIKTVTNGVDLERFSPRQKAQNLISDLELQGKFVVGYIGTHGMAHGLETIIDAAEIVQKSDLGDGVQFLFLGDGAMKSRLIQRAHQLQLNNVIFLDSVQKDQVVSYWTILDLCIVHLKKDPLFETVIPSKIFESMAMGIPLVHCVPGESASIVADRGAGLVCQPEDATAIALAILESKGDQTLLERFSKNGLDCAKEYSREQLAMKMLNHLQALKQH